KYYVLGEREELMMFATIEGEGLVRLRLVSRANVTENQIMAAPVISILSYTSEESVGSHAPRVILFGAIPAIIPAIPRVPIVPADPIVTPEVGIVSVVSPAGVLDLVDYSSSFDSDPSEDSLPPAPDLPLFPLAHVVALPGILRRLATLVRPGEAIPFGRLYRTHLNRPRKLLTARKRVRPIPARRLAWRRVSHHSSDCHSSPDSSSSSAPSYHSLSGHTPPDTTDGDSSTPQRFVHRSLARTPRRSEAFRRWRSTLLSTPYPPTTSVSSLCLSSERSLDSSSLSSRPSHKRCRSHTALVPSPTYVSRSIAPTPVDLLPPRKRFRDSYSPEDSGEEHMELDTADAELLCRCREDDEEFEAEASAADTKEIVVDPLANFDSSKITEIETTQRKLKTSQMVASGERASLLRGLGGLETAYLKEALAAYEATRAANALKAENQSQNGSDDDNGNGRDGNGGNGNGGNGNPNENNMDARWFEKMETMFHISNCPEKYQVKYATCTLLNSALTWWNSHKRTIRAEAAFAMSWRELIKLMAEVTAYEMKSKRWNLSCGI
ncbi:hypothetical protein Tco_0014755, partial [Tanacetum coccineum]